MALVLRLFGHLAGAAFLRVAFLALSTVLVYCRCCGVEGEGEGDGGVGQIRELRGEGGVGTRLLWGYEREGTGDGWFVDI